MDGAGIISLVEKPDANDPLSKLASTRHDVVTPDILKIYRLLRAAQSGEIQLPDQIEI